jgi:tetratricopeptide (TPR) repeat protein
MQEAAKLDPTYEIGVAQHALQTNRLEESIEAYNKFRAISPDYYELWQEMSIPYYMLERYKEALEVLETNVENYPEVRRDIRFVGFKAVILCALGRIDEVKKLVDDIFNLEYDSLYSPGFILEIIARELKKQGYRDLSSEVLNRGVDWQKTFQPNRKYLIASLLYVDEQWEEAKVILETLIEQEPENIKYKGFLGKIYAKLGEKEAALNIYGWLESLELEYRRYLPFKFQAEIMAGLGEKEKAVDLLREAYRKGLIYGPGMLFRPEVFWNIDVEKLKGYPPYEEFQRPKK